MNIVRPVPARIVRQDWAQRAVVAMTESLAEALTRLADASEVMPPKTTYFEPKPCAGIFLRP